MKKILNRNKFARIMAYIYVIVFLNGTFSSASEEISPPFKIPTEPDAVVLQWGYSNYAWKHQNYSFSLSRNGNVLFEDFITQTYYEDKVDPIPDKILKFIAQINPDDLSKKVNTAKDAGNNWVKIVQIRNGEPQSFLIDRWGDFSQSVGGEYPLELRKYIDSLGIGTTAATPQPKISLVKKTVTLKLKGKKTITLKPTIKIGGKKLTAKQLKKYKMTYSSSNKKIAKVSKTGKVTALKTGKVKIKVKLKNGEKTVCTITVKKK